MSGPVPSASAPPLRLALLGDLHFCVPRWRPGDLFSKRLLGQVNFLLRRKKAFRHERLPALLERIRADKPDLLVFTGDFTQTGLAAEFHAAAHALAPLSGLPRVAVPGNHDRYVADCGKNWEDAARLLGAPAGPFPMLRPLGSRWHILLLDAAKPRFGFSARGHLGPAQLEAARRLLAPLREDEGLLVVCHYPLHLEAGHPLRTLRDLEGRRELAALLGACPARVVYLHGHVHDPWHLKPGAQGAAFDCINAGAPVQCAGRYPLGQGHWIVDLPADPRGELGMRHEPGR